MHARLDQLLSLRDGAPVDAELRAHVQQCAQCLAELARLAHVRERLRALPPIDAPRDFWQHIETHAAAPQRRSRIVGIAASIGAVALVALGYFGARDRDAETQRMTRSAAPFEAFSPDAANDELERLIAQSRELEAVLSSLPERPHVERVSTAITVDSIERRIQWLDWQLANGSDAQLDRRQAQRLWSERVDLMDSLVKVRYAESAPLVF